MIEQLLSQVQTINSSYERLTKSTGENFNIFSIMRMETNEVKTHSRFLTELLNPGGSHNQGAVFLKLFLDLFASEIKFNFGNTYAEDEFYIGKKTKTNGGSIDIVVTDKNNYIMIENKIYANEQENQLLRYYNFKSTGKLFYLTLDGKESDENSLAKELYTCISYETDIINWLELCKKEVADISIIRESINQYINLIKKLTNQNTRKQMNNDIVDIILANNKNFDAFKKLIATKNSIFRNTLERKVFPELEEISEELNLELRIDKELFLGSGNYLFFSFFNRRNQLEITFQFQGVKHKALIFGFIKEASSNMINQQIIMEKFSTMYEDYKSSESWFCYYDFHEFYNWEDINTLEKLQFGEFKKNLKQKLVTLIID